MAWWNPVSWFTDPIIEEAELRARRLFDEAASSASSKIVRAYLIAFCLLVAAGTIHHVLVRSASPVNSRSSTADAPPLTREKHPGVFSPSSPKDSRDLQFGKEVERQVRVTSDDQIIRSWGPPPTDEIIRVWNVVSVHAQPDNEIVRTWGTPPPGVPTEEEADTSAGPTSTNGWN